MTLLFAFAFNAMKNCVLKIKFVSFTGAAAASRVFNEALAKIAVNAQHGGTTDIGKSIFYYKRIQQRI